MFCILGGDRESCRVIEELVKKASSLELIGTFSEQETFRNLLLQGEKGALIFIDLDTVKFDIFDFLKSLQDQPNIILISASDQFALKAFDLNVIDYLSKPVAFPRFLKAIDKANKYYSHKEVSNKGDNQIFIKKGSSLVKLKIKDIVFIEALENYITLNTTDGKYLIHFTMKGIENQLPSSLFIRIHRSFIINKSIIHAIHESSLDLTIGNTIKTLPIGKSFREILMNDINLMSRQ
jgi:DNA-binding LytR/AlgR family response regulator